ncbi:MAG TPA: TonB family protein [Verrucomicrobiae bacterium]|jgi:TonB family protein
MNRLEKKCLIATTGFHLLLVVILLVGPGFFTEKPKPDDASMLEVVPDTTIEAALTSGVKDAKPPAPTPIVTPPPQPVVVPPPPQVDPTPPPPEVKPETPTFIEKVEKIFKPEPVKPDPDPTPTPDPKPAKQTKPKPVTKPVVKPKREIDLTKVTRTEQQDDVAQKAAAETRRQQREVQRQAQMRADAIKSAVRNLQDNFTSSTKVEMPGSSSVSYAGYASVIKSIYTRRWQPPASAADDEANIKVSITVSRDGTVVSSQILSGSGDSSVDASVQRTLDRVTFIAPFPDGSTEKTKTFIINFNLKAKRMLG